MSENYGVCARCAGAGKIMQLSDGEVIECSRCDGTGKSGDAMDYQLSEIKKDEAKEPVIKGTNWSDL